MTRHLLVIAAAAYLVTAGIVQAAPLSARSIPDRPNAVNAQLSPAQRGALVAHIVHAWGPFVQHTQRDSVGAWSARMRGTFAAATDSNLQRAAGMKTFQGMMDALVGQHLTDTQVIDSLALQAQVLHSNAVPALLGSTTADLVYTPLAPCRIADTRVAGAGGPIAANTSRGFSGWVSVNYTAQGGSNTNCGIPNNPSALMMNVTAVSPSAAGYLTLFPFGTARPRASNLNYVAGTSAGNEIASKMTIGSTSSDFSVYSFASTNVVIDVVGYFMAPEATPLDTFITNGAMTTILAGSDAVVYSSACPANFVETGVYCGSALGKPGIYLIGVDNGGCSWRNQSATAVTMYTRTQCARIPGR